MPKAYISSTFKDLQQHRAIVHTVLKRFGYDDVAMEYYVAEDQRPLDRCLADVADCDLYIGVFAWRYGYVPDKDNPDRLAITELEYRRAVERDKPRLLFVIDEEAEWPIKFVDPNRGNIAAFHERLYKDRLSGTFSTPDTLEARLSAALEQRTGNVLRVKGIDVPAYVRFLRSRYNILDLDALTDPKRDEGLQLRVQSVFVEQSVREDPPPLELPKEAWQLLITRADINADDLPEGLNEEVLSELQASYATKPVKPVLDVLATAEVRCAIILGDPGSGKSTLLRFIALSLIDSANNQRLQPGLAACLPFLIDLKAYAALRGQKRCETFFEYFDILAKEESCPANGAALKRYLEDEHPAAILFDGIDEIFNPAEQETITRQITAFAASHPTARVIVTSRIIGYRRSLLTQAGFSHYTLQDLDETQIREFVTQWYTLTLGSNPAEAQARVDRILQSFSDSSSIRQLAGNPMLLTIMAIIGKHQELPRERWKLYDHATSVLVQHWDVRKHLADKQLGADLMDEEDKKELLRRLAYAMQGGKGGLAGNYIHAKELQTEFEAYLRQRYALPLDRAKVIAREMITQFRERNFILSFYGANVYGFVHRAFLEFFCADAIRMKFEKTKELPLADLKTQIFGAHCQEKPWQEVLLLICGMIGEEFVGELIEYLQSLGYEHTDGTNIKVAIQCLGEIRRVELVADAAAGLLQTLLDWTSTAVKHGQTFGDAFWAAGFVGARWPSRELIASWVADQNNDGKSLWSSGYSYLVGLRLGAIASGLSSVRDAAIKRLRTDPGGDLSKLLIKMLAYGWRDDEVADLLLKSAIEQPSLQYACIGSLAEFFSHRHDIVDWIFDRANDDSYLARYVIDDLYDHPRAVPFLIEELQGASRSVWNALENTEKLEKYVDQKDVQRTLRALVKNHEKPEVRAKAAAILQHHGILLTPPKKRRAGKRLGK